MRYSMFCEASSIILGLFASHSDPSNHCAPDILQKMSAATAASAAAVKKSPSMSNYKSFIL
jgi:hypothetical protein